MIERADIHLVPMLLAAVLLAIGIFVGDAFCGGVSFAVALTVVGVLFVAFCIFRNRQPLSGILFIPLVISFGIFIYINSASKVPSLYSDGYEGWEGVLMSRPQQHGKVYMADAMVTSGRMCGHYVRVSIFADNRSRFLDEGHGIRCVSVFEPIEDFGVKRNFSYSRWAMSHDIVGRTFLYTNAWDAADVRLTHLSKWKRIVVKCSLLRGNVARKLRMDISDDDAAALVSALTLGDRSGITKELREMYSVAGGSHVLALSGMHLGIIFFVLSYVFFRRRYKVFGGVLTLSFIWGYAVFTGMSPSIMRAAVMLTVYSVVEIIGNYRNQLNTLGVAAVSILAFSPFSLWDVGFQMSIISMLGIILFYKPLYSLIPAAWLFRCSILRYLWSVVCVSLSAQICVAPIVAFYFGRFSCYFVLTGIVVSVLAVLIIVGTLAMLLAMAAGVGTDFLGNVLSHLANWQNEALAWISSLPHASIENIRINCAQLILIYIVIIALIALAYRISRVIRINRLWHSVTSYY